jgi:hypothetical protein
MALVYESDVGCQASQVPLAAGESLHRAAQAHPVLREILVDLGEDASRFVWVADLLPHDRATPTREAMEQGTRVVKKTLEARTVRG